MGMFDSLYDQRDNEWQTKAYNCELDCYGLGDRLPPIVGVPDDYQVEVLGDGDRPREFRYAFATVRDGLLMAVGVDRDPSLPRVNYSGHLIESAATHTPPVEHCREGRNAEEATHG